MRVSHERCFKRRTTKDVLNETTRQGKTRLLSLSVSHSNYLDLYTFYSIFQGLIFEERECDRAPQNCLRSVFHLMP